MKRGSGGISPLRATNSQKGGRAGQRIYFNIKEIEEVSNGDGELYVKKSFLKHLKMNCLKNFEKTNEVLLKSE